MQINVTNNASEQPYAHWVKWEEVFENHARWNFGVYKVGTPIWKGGINEVYFPYWLMSRLDST